MGIFRRRRSSTGDVWPSSQQEPRKTVGDNAANAAVNRNRSTSGESAALVQSLASLSTLDVASVHYSMGAAATGAGLTVQLGCGAPSLRHLDLSNLARDGAGRRKKSVQPLDAVACEALARTLRQCPSLVTLSLAGNSLQDAALRVLVDAMAVEEAGSDLAALEDLDLSRNRLQDGNLLARLVAGPGARCLASLNLEANQLGDEALMAFSAGLCMCGQLRRLNLARNGIADRGVIALAQALKHQRDEISVKASENALNTGGLYDVGYRHFHLDDCWGDVERSTPAFLQDMHGSGLASLDLSSTLIGDTGAEHLAAVMMEDVEGRTPSLRRLNLYDTRIGCRGRDAFEKLVRASHENIERQAEAVRVALQSGGPVPFSWQPMPLCVQGLRLEAIDADFTARVAFLAQAARARSKFSSLAGSDSCCSVEGSCIDDTECATTIGDEPEEDGSQIIKFAHSCTAESSPPAIARSMSGMTEETEIEAPVGRAEPTKQQQIDCDREVAELRARRIVQHQVKRLTEERAAAIEHQNEDEELPSFPRAAVDWEQQSHLIESAQVFTTTRQAAPAQGMVAGDSALALPSPVAMSTSSVGVATTDAVQTPTAASRESFGVASEKLDTADEAGGPGSPSTTSVSAQRDCTAEVVQPASGQTKGKGKGKAGAKGCPPPPPPPKGAGKGGCAPPATIAVVGEEGEAQSVEGVLESPAKRVGKGAPPPPKGKGKGSPPAAPGKGAPPPPASGKGGPPAAKGKGGPPAPKGKGGAPPPGGKGGPKGKAPPAEPSKTPFNRKLYWKQLELGDAEGTIFSEGGTDGSGSESKARVSNPRIDVDALQRMFEGESKEAEKTNERSQRLLQARMKADEGVKVLDPKRAQNIAIVLRRLPLPTEELAEILRGLRWEHEGLLTEQIEIIQEVLPTAEESEALSAHLDPEARAKLRDIERMVLPLSQLKRGKSRLKLINCARSAEAQLESITRPFAHFREACDAIQGSEMLREVLLIALDVGNYINHGNLQHSRAARAISIGSLLQFRDFKSGRMSSLHFFCAQLYSADSSRDAAAVLESELRPVIFAAKQQLQSVLLAATAFEQDLKMIKTECQVSTQYDDEADSNAEESSETAEATSISGSARSRLLKLHDVVETFAEQLNADKERTAAQVRDTLRFCGVSLPASKQPLLEFEPFLGHLAEFVNAFAQHWHEVKSDLPKYSKFFPGLQEICIKDDSGVPDGDMAAGKARKGGSLEGRRRRRCSV